MKITISQEGTSPISITVPDNNIRSEEAIVYASYLKYRTEKDYLSSDKFTNNLMTTFNKLKSSGLTILNKDSIKSVRRSFGTALKEIFGGKQLTEPDLYNSVKWIKINNIDICVVTNVNDNMFTNALSYKDYFIWYTKDNKTCKAKRVGALQMKGTYW